MEKTINPTVPIDNDDKNRVLKYVSDHITGLSGALESSTSAFDYSEEYLEVIRKAVEFEQSSADKTLDAIEDRGLYEAMQRKISNPQAVTIDQETLPRGWIADEDKAHAIANKIKPKDLRIRNLGGVSEYEYKDPGEVIFLASNIEDNDRLRAAYLLGKLRICEKVEELEKDLD